MPEIIKAGDLLRAPPKVVDVDAPRYDTSKLPESWRKVVEKIEEWPFVNPDVMLEEEVDSFHDFPSDPDDMPEGVIPFSEFEPWGKMEEETEREYELFSHYRASGLSRTHSKTARHFNVSQPYIWKTAKKRDWVDRIAAWDEYREQIYTSTVIEKVKKMAEDHADIASKGIQSLSMVFDELIRRVEEEPELHKSELEELGFRSLFGLAEKAARAVPNLMNAERLSRGLPTELTAEVKIKENRVTIQTTDELAEILTGLSDVLSVDKGEVIDVDEVEEEDIDVEEDIDE